MLMAVVSEVAVCVDVGTTLVKAVVFDADGRELVLMPAGSVLVNCARGGLLDYHALVKALTGGHLCAAAVDVYDEEPLHCANPEVLS